MTDTVLHGFEHLTTADLPPDVGNGHNQGHDSTTNGHKRPDGATVPGWQSRFRPLADILAEPAPTVEWLVDGLVPRGWAGLLAGDTKTGKTLLALELAKAVATGGVFLGKQATPGSVLLALADDPPILSRRRLESLAGSPNVFVDMGRWNRDAMTALMAGVKEVRPALVVIDTLVKATSSMRGDENDASTMDRLLERFVGLTVNEQTTVLVVHHLSKAGTVRGSTAIESALPFVMRLDRTDNGDDGAEGERLLRLAVEWKLEPVPPLMLTYTGAAFSPLGSPADVQAARLDARILAVLEQTPGLSTQDVAKRTEKRADTVNAALKRLATAGQVRCKTVPLPRGRGRPRGCWFVMTAPAWPTNEEGGNVVPPIPFPIGNKNNEASISGGAREAPIFVPITGNENRADDTAISGTEGRNLIPDSERLDGNEYTAEEPAWFSEVFDRGHSDDD